MPHFVAGRSGTRLFSLAALAERIVDAFYAEHGGRLSAEVMDKPAQRRRLIIETADYVLAVESVALSLEQRAELLESVYGELFGYGPLDSLLIDPRVTTIAIEGAGKTAVRFGHGELKSLGTLFDDEQHLRRIIGRLLADAGIEIESEWGLLEVGLTIAERPVCLNLAGPPLTVTLHADIRLHPRRPPLLSELVEQGWMTEEAGDLITKIARSPYGCIIAGETETGKTTLLNAISHLLPVGQTTASVERAGELRPPSFVQRFIANASAFSAGVTSFSDQIAAALSGAPACLLLDEVRGNEPAAIAPLLLNQDAPRQLWAVRGVPDAKRLQSALGMLARRAVPTHGEGAVHALYERLPFVITLARIQGRLQVFSIAEWQSRVDSDYPDYAVLMRYEDGQARRTSQPLARWLD
ncbi:MAG: ATPase, T2SS/T4P/T4SS family [Aggregatilineales bacterium]